MKQIFKLLTAFFFVALFAVQVSAQSVENTYNWFPQSHSAWKVEPVSPFGYVIAGNKFFSAPNTNIYMTGFDEFGTHQWTRTHATEFTSLQTFWKSFVKTTDDYPGFFVVCAGNSGGNKAYALLTNQLGMKFWDRVSPLPFGIQFGGVTTATNGGYMATGSTNAGNFAVVKFDAFGVLEWARDLGVSGFGWTISAAVGGGYVMAGTAGKVVKVDPSGNVDWTANINIPASPSGAYTYSEFEEILPLPDGTGFVVTGSCFSNSHSGNYTARVSYTGGVAWAKVNDQVNTGLAGTPVAWVNNAVIDKWGTEILTSWRRGPVSTGGTMFYQRYNFSGTALGGITSFGNSIPVQEAFMTKAHQKYVIAGVRGSYTAAYSYINASLPSFKGSGDDRSEPLVETNPLLPVQTSLYNSQPIFELPPASRVFASKMRVFPNPSSGLFSVGGAIEPGALLRVLSPMGALVLERRIQPGETLVQLDLSSMSTGLYTVEMIGDAGLTTQKVIVE